MDIQTLISKIQANLSDDLLKPQYRNSKKNKFWGHCYVASEALYHLLGGSKSNFRPKRIKIDNINHWFLENIDSKEVIDITAEQFDFKIDYSQSKRVAFLTKQPSRRARKLIDRIT